LLVNKKTARRQSYYFTIVFNKFVNSGEEGLGASAFTIFPSGPIKINLGIP
jgi:hypothetical protein